MIVWKYLRLVLRNFKIFVVVFVIAIYVANYINQTSIPLYRSYAQLFVSTPASNVDVSALVQGSTFGTSRVKSYADIITSPEVLKPVIERLGLTVNYKELAKSVEAEAPMDTVLISLSATSSDPRTAALIVNEISNQFAYFVQLLEIPTQDAVTSVRVTLVKPGQIPEYPFSPKKTYNFFIALLGATLVSFGLSLLKENLNRSVKNQDDVAPISLLGVLPFRDEVKDNPILGNKDVFSTRMEGFRGVRENFIHISEQERATVFAITSAVPGEGKTSSCLNLAYALSTSGNKVLVIESDLRKPSAHDYIGLKREPVTLNSILGSGFKVPRANMWATKGIIQEYRDNCFVLLGGRAESDPTRILSSEKFKNLVAQAELYFDYVFLDCPPVLPVADALTLSRIATRTIVVVHAGRTTKDQFSLTLQSLSLVGVVPIGAILNMVPNIRFSDSYGYKYQSKYTLGNYEKKYGKYRINGNYGYYDNGSGTNTHSESDAKLAFKKLLKIQKKSKKESQLGWDDKTLIEYDFNKSHFRK